MSLISRARLLWRLVRMNVMLTLEYRVGFLLSMTTLVLNPAIALLVWLAVDEAGGQLPYSREEFVTYFVLMGLASLATQTWTAEYVQEDIKEGYLNRSLVRPAPNVLHYVANNLGEKVVKLVLLAPPLFVLAFLFRDALRLPTALLPWLLFLGSLILAATLAFLLDYLTGSLAFWLQDTGGLRSLFRLAANLLSGRLVPLAFFPSALAGLLAVQPFRFLLSFPLELLTGSLPAEAIAQGFSWQGAYVLAALLGYRLVWRFGLRAYAASGA